MTPIDLTNDQNAIYVEVFYSYIYKLTVKICIIDKT